MARLEKRAEALAVVRLEQPAPEAHDLSLAEKMLAQLENGTHAARWLRTALLDGMGPDRKQLTLGATWRKWT